MPIVQIHVLEGRNKQQIARLVANVSEAVAASLEVKPEQVRVLVTEVPPSHWGVGGITKEEQS
ncbi:4-oxalocrotonate tautomerase [Brevibacillus borstelensis]|uniref:4-oxalocrotonate tautomerase n=1 Tax=Brevibacillus borstelensis TaxID=45462 RepID=UPI0030C055AA